MPVGAPCNVCEPENPIYATITRLRPDGGGREIFARGIRNTVGFDWQPGSAMLWFTENGRDRLGDDVPPDELNRAPQAGLHFGFPYCHGRVPDPDPELGNGAAAAAVSRRPALELGPHVAAIGMRFYTGADVPGRLPQPGLHRRARLVEPQPADRLPGHAGRGSEGDQALSYETFAEGWLRPDGKAWGRPVDVEVAAGRRLLVSDDEAGAVYRITHGRRGR